MLEDNFMLDSLNEQRNADSHLSKPSADFRSRPRNESALVASSLQLSKIKETSERSGETDHKFMNVLQTAISHFEKETQPQKDTKSNKEVKKLMVHHMPAHKHSPTSSYNSSNTTTANSTGEPKNEEESGADVHNIKREYSTLMVKYNELKASNKGLMNDYAVLRSQFEEMKAVIICARK